MDWDEEHYKGYLILSSVHKTRHLTELMIATSPYKIYILSNQLDQWQLTTENGHHFKR